ncbi:hypothetical protein Zmor_008975 [Zophobas morio]|jgi:uncharacterized protein YkvS|uniref:Uncharacterized protein n=1 Tax=Zophobas morio TaxID=2755281 RepID=A0AA38HK13_9CUCU|nr:hypothetical protein Zmor_008975 [Zophobas morio]
MAPGRYISDENLEVISDNLSDDEAAALDIIEEKNSEQSGRVSETSVIIDEVTAKSEVNDMDLDTKIVTKDKTTRSCNPPQ